MNNLAFILQQLPGTFLLLLTLSGIHLQSFAQSTFEKVYGGELPEMFRTVMETNDGNLLAAGYTQSFGSGAVNSPDFFVVKMNSDGDTIWTRAFGNASIDDAYSVTEMNDGYIIAGYGLNPATNTNDFYVVKTDAGGIQLWDEYYGGSGGDYCAHAIALSGNRVLLGGSSTSFTAGGFDFYLVETDSNGVELASAHYGGTGGEILKKIVPANDGGFLLVGNSNSFNPTFDVYIVKIDSNLSFEWSQTFSSPLTDYGYDGAQDADGNFYILANQPGSPDSSLVSLIKTDDEGLNAVTLPVALHAGDYGYDLQLVTDGFLITGYTFAPLKGSELLLVKTMMNGDTLWTHHYGGSKNEVAFSVLSLENGDIVIAGETEGFGVDNFDAYLVRLTAAGEVPCPNEVSFIMSDSSLCEDQTVFFTNTTVSSVLFSWAKNGNSFSDDINTALFFSDAGNDTVTLSACTAEYSKTLEIYPKPPSHFTYQVSGTSATFLLVPGFSVASFSWDYGDGSPINTSDLTPVHMYTNPGLYWVTFSATDLHGCDSTYIEQIDLITGIDDLQKLHVGLSIIPNPMHEGGEIVIGENILLPAEATLYDLCGKVLRRFPVLQSRQEFTTESLNQGTYLLSLKSKEGIIIVEKLVIE